MGVNSKKVFRISIDSKEKSSEAKVIEKKLKSLGVFHSDSHRFLIKISKNMDDVIEAGIIESL